MAFCSVEDIAPIRNAWWVALGLAAATGLAFLLARPKAPRRAWAGLAVGLFWFPAWQAILAVLPDLVKTFCAQGDVTVVVPGGVTLPTAPGPVLSRQFIRAILDTLGPLALGGLALLQARQPGWWRQPRIATLARGLAGLVPMGKGEPASLRLGFAVFPLLALGNVVLLLLTNDPRIRNGDDSAYFAGVGLYHVLLISAAAALAEELLYRGVLQQGLKAIAPVWVALPAQAVVFAYAHASYGNLQHLLFAFAFALVAGLVVERWGVWCAIALHFLIDFYALGLSAAQAKGASLLASDPLLALGLAGVGVGVLWVSAKELARWRRRHTTPPA